MKTSTHTKTVITYASTICPEYTSTNENDAALIEWADTNPVVWKIVTANKSKAFGKSSSDHIGWARGGSVPVAVIERLRTLKHALENTFQNDFWSWRARFTIQHYNDKGFKGGFFQQFDGTYHRGCNYLDYTPKTLDLVVKRFLEWCDAGYKFPTVAVKLDTKVIRTFKVKP